MFLNLASPHFVSITTKNLPTMLENSFLKSKPDAIIDVGTYHEPEVIMLEIPPCLEVNPLYIACLIPLPIFVIQDTAVFFISYRKLPIVGYRDEEIVSKLFLSPTQYCPINNNKLAIILPRPYFE